MTTTGSGRAVVLALLALTAVVLALAKPGEQILDVTRYGADGGDTLDDSAAIQRCLDRAQTGAVTVEVPAGVYYLAHPLELYSRTTLRLAEGAVMVRAGNCRTMLKTAASEAGGWRQQHDLVIEGGLWEGNPWGLYPGTEASDCATELIKLRHSRNIVLRDTVLQNNAGAAHLVELLGCRRVCIENCTLLGHRDTGGEREFYKEAIQLDYCWAERPDCTSSPIGDAYPYDGTVCRDITVQGCDFSHYMSGVGQHYNYSPPGEGRSRDIRILDNTFTGLTSAALRLYTMDGVTVRGNQFRYCRTGIALYDSAAELLDNRFQHSGSRDLLARAGSALLLGRNAFGGAASCGTGETVLLLE